MVVVNFVLVDAWFSFCCRWILRNASLSVIALKQFSMFSVSVMHFAGKASVRSLYLLCFVANEVIGIDCRCVKVVCTYLTYH